MLDLVAMLPGSKCRTSAQHVQNNSQTYPPPDCTVLSHGQCPWAMPMGNAHGQCPWAMPMGNAHGDCPWRLPMGIAHGVWNILALYVLVLVSCWFLKYII